MRTKLRIRRKIVLLCFTVFIGLFFYILGYSQGQASVYTKVSNDKKLMHMMYGE